MQAEPKGITARNWRRGITLFMIPVFFLSACTTPSSPDYADLPDLAPEQDQTLHRVTLRVTVKGSGVDDEARDEGELALAREKAAGYGFDAIKNVSYSNGSLVSFDLPAGRYQLVAMGEATCDGLVLEVAPEASRSLYAGSLEAVVREQEVDGKIRTDISLDVQNELDAETQAGANGPSSGLGDVKLALLQEASPAPSCHAEGDTAATVVGKVVLGVLVVAGIIALAGLFLLLGIASGFKTK
jgi:hypothetical protein